MAATRRKRKKYSSAERQQVLAAAQSEGLTADQVQKKFGVTPVTYYSWRKKSGVTRRKRRGPDGSPRRGGDELTNQVRSEVRTRVSQILPSIVRTEVNNYLNAVLAPGRGARRRRT